jgi:hypothetical protein
MRIIRGEADVVGLLAFAARISTVGGTVLEFEFDMVGDGFL